MSLQKVKYKNNKFLWQRLLYALDDIHERQCLIVSPSFNESAGDGHRNTIWPSTLNLNFNYVIATVTKILFSAYT